MYKLFILLLFLPLFVFGQSNRFLSKVELTKIYTKAIKNIINEASKKNNTEFDTLYFGKHIDFPDIKLPQVIEKTHIKLISTELGALSQKEHKTRVYINMIGWVEKDKAEFIFIVFSNGFDHQYDCYISYCYDFKRKKLGLKISEFKFPPFSN